MENEDYFKTSKDRELKKRASSSMELSSGDTEKKEVELEVLAKEFAAHKVSAAGVSYIVSSRSNVRRALWFIAVMSCITFMGYMTLNVILEYLSYPKILIKEDAILHRLPFPGVTICSLNPISNHFVAETSLKKFLALKEMMDAATSESRNNTSREICIKNPLCQWSWFQEKCFCVNNPCLTEFCLPENSTHCSCLWSFCENKHIEKKVCGMMYLNSTFSSTQKKRACHCKGTSGQKTTESWKKENLKDLLSTVKNKDVRELIRLIKRSKTYDLDDIAEALMPTAKELYEYGSTYDTLVASCSYEGVHCFRENFTVLYDPTYGKCYMFNYIGSDITGSDKPIEIDTYGSTSGLQLLLRVTDNNALDLLRREIGARVVIHDPHILPFVSEYGVNVRPKDMTSLELSLSKVERLKAPWGNCDDDLRRMQNGDPYSVLGCEKFCILKDMTTRCNCTLRHLLRGTVLNQLRPPYPLCNISDENQKDCAFNVTEDIYNRPDCNCLSPCSETVYEYAVTSSKLNQNFYRMVKAIRTLNVGPNGNQTYMSYEDRKSMVGIKVYYNTFQVSTNKEVPNYSWETLMANIGGNLGFFMGLTLVTFLEIAEFIWDFITTFLRRVSPCNSIRKLSTT
ncbi:degenerin-like protein unc-105 [Caerostris darwini]|uniref:Degenerin-like protein unc-105 n=1 Tax=Caerostris darwini TaxID=1538125 RepID=A0AAV4P4U1_9ARAC|nr:degenerin-like protein unc-105 [Caerostris darwini]